MMRPFLMVLFLCAYACTGGAALWFFYAEEYAKSAAFAAFAILNNAHYRDVRDEGE